jgi:Arc/MetJ-type ribon-helix-helix transcriptional regulator
VPEALLETLDALVADGRYANRTAAVRDALERLVAAERRREVDRLIVEGYSRKPPDQTSAFSRAMAERSIEQEPW